MGFISRKQLDEELMWHSDSVSKSVRTAAFAAIAGVWAVMTAESLSIGPSGGLGIPTACLVTLVFSLASLTLLVDVSQYLAAYLMTNRGIDRWEAREEKGEKVEFRYDKKNLGKYGMVLRSINFWAFRAKAVTAIATGAVFLLFALSIQLD